MSTCVSAPENASSSSNVASGAISNLAGLSITLAMYVVILGIKVWFSYTHCDPDNKAAEVNMQRFSPGVQRFLFGRAVPASRP